MVIATRGKATPLIIAVAMCAFPGAVWGQSGAAEASKSVTESSVASRVHPALYFSKREVEASFEHPKRVDGALYVSDYGTRSFEVKTSTRDKPLLPEVHMTFTDIIYVVKGSATLVTGGKLVGDLTPRTYPDGKPFGKET